MPTFLFLVAVVCLALAAIVGRRRSAPGAVPLIALLIAVAGWNVGYGLEVAVADLSQKLFWVNMQYIGIVATPVAILAFALGYSGHGAWLTPTRLALLSVIPLATLLLAWTNTTHGLVWRTTGLSASAGEPLALDHGPAFYVDWVYAYVLFFASALLLIAGGMSLRPYFVRQAVAVAVAFTMPWAGNAAYVLGATPGGVDFTNIGFAVTAVVLVVACLRWGLLDIAPIARSALIEHMRGGMVVVDERGRLVDCNGAARPLLSCDADDAIGRHASDALATSFDRLWPAPDELPPAGLLRVIEIEEEGGERAFEAEVVGLPGRPGRLLIFNDVTAREQVQAQLVSQALTDDLTKIGNRRLLLDRIQRALVDTSRHRRLLAVVFVDLDDFKSVNDTHGHDRGDAVLIEAARRLEQCVRPGDTVARLGGDEFAILLTELDSEGDADPVADRIAAAFREPFDLGGRSQAVSASLGLHVTHGDGCTPASLLHSADEKMYAAKQRPRRHPLDHDKQPRLMSGGDPA